MTSNYLRSFVAIELPPPVKAGLGRVQAGFKAARMDILRWVKPDSIHLTLKFLGDVAEEQVPEMSKAIEDAAAGIAPFELELDKLGVFPNLRQPRVFWAGIGGDVNSLKALQGNIDIAFGLLGFPDEEREFTAHLTLARVRDEATPDQKRAFGDLVARSRLEARSRFQVTGINLMRSQLTPQGAIYTCLASVPLAPR